MYEVRMPKLALGDDDVMTVIGWRVAVGQAVIEGDVLLEVETDKATLEVPASGPGTVVRLVVAQGQQVAPGDLLAIMAPVGVEPSPEDVDALLSRMFDVSTGGEQPTPSAPPGDAGVQSQPTIARPTLHRMAQGALLGVPRFPRRRVGLSEALAVPADSVVGGDVEQVELSRHRLAVARAMTASAQIPQFPVFRDMRVVGLKRSLELVRSEIPDATLTDLLVLAVGRVLAEHRRFNSWFDHDRMRTFSTVNISLAIDGPDGVVAPVIRRANDLTIEQIVMARADVVSRARERGLRPEDLVGGTFALSNLGGLGASAVAPLVTPPQVAVLGVGRLRPIGSAALMTMALVADHRAVDGADSARFLSALEGTFDELPGSITA